MAIKNLIGPGIGFSPGGIKYLVLRGLSPVAGPTALNNYCVQAGQLYVPGARIGQVVPNSVTGDEYMATAAEGDVR